MDGLREDMEAVVVIGEEVDDGGVERNDPLWRPLTA